nr:glycosyl transferase family 1 [uncultured Gammaproteobacteria bacterium]
MSAPLIVHVIHRLGVGGLENGLVNLLNHLPQDRYRHAIVCLTEATAFKQRLRRPVPIYALNKREGQDWRAYLRFYRLLRELEPKIVHTRNLATLECQFWAYLAGVPIRIHGEHGWDSFDPDGRKYRNFRRWFRPLIRRYIALSRQIETYLREEVGVPAAKIVRIVNGVDAERFSPPPNGRAPILGCPFADPKEVLIGTVGRMHGVKDQPTLVKAFIALLERYPHLKAHARLVLVGEGPLRAECQRLLDRAGLSELAWLAGERDDVPEVLRGLDVFVLPSQAEGISNTLLEAMATGLPVVATAVGGNVELVAEGENGTLVPKEDPERLAEALAGYVESESRRKTHGRCGRAKVEERFTLTRMIENYMKVYDSLLSQ